MDKDSRLLQQAAQRFQVTVAQLSPLSGGHYAQVYEWVQGGRRAVLKISPVEGADDLQSMRATLEWLAYLKAQGAPVVCPVRSQQGNLIEPIEHEGQTYLVSAFEKIAGVRAETLPPGYWDAAAIQKLGRVMGRCHALAQTYVPASPALRRAEWDATGNCFNPARDLATADAFVIEKRAQILNVIQALPKDRASYGLAHLDLHFANFMVDAQSRDMALIDFDDCGYGWYAMDVAMLVFDVRVVYADQQPKKWGTHFLAELLKGYRAENEFSEFWVGQLPAFLKLVEIGVYAMLARQYDPATCQDAWVKKFMLDRERRIRDDVPYMEFMG